MRKEVLIAIIIGIFIGTLFAFGVWRANSALSPSPQPDKNNSSEKVQNNEEIKSLVISKPQDNSVSIDEIVAIEGITSPRAMLIAVSNKNEKEIALANDHGEFSTNLTVHPGINNIDLTAFNDTNLIDNQKIQLVYSAEISDNIEGESPEDRLKRAANPPKAILGTITDITENFIQVQNGQDQIEQVALNEATTFTNIVKEQTEVDLNDLAIGDYIAAIGFNSENTLVARRIIITLPSDKSNTQVLFGTVNELSAKDFLIQVGDKEWSIDATGKVQVTTIDDGNLSTIRFAQIDPEDTIIVVGTVDEDSGELSADLVHLVKKFETPIPETNN